MSKQRWLQCPEFTSVGPDKVVRRPRDSYYALMPALIIFVCSGLLVYWFSRMLLLLNGSKEEIDETLESDLWWGRRVVIGFR